MNALVPIKFGWNGEAMVPSNPFWARKSDQQFVIGQVYNLVDEPERSSKSHRHYFSCVNEAWANLPPHLADQHPTADHLRRRALIEAGYCDNKTIVCSSKAEALRVAAFVKPIDCFAVVTVRDNVVTHSTAHSQSTRAMGAAKFQLSKDATLEIISAMIGTTKADLEKQHAKETI